MKTIIVIDGNYWLVEDDGNLRAISVAEVQQLKSTSEATVISGDNSLAFGATPQQSNNASQGDSGSGNSDVSQPSPLISLATFFTRIGRGGFEQLPESGFKSSQFVNVLGDSSFLDFPSEVPSPPPLPEDAQITVTIEDNGDGFISRFEVAIVDIFGSTFNLYNGQLIQIDIVDTNGQMITFITKVDDDGFSLEDKNLSGLAQGPVTVTATASDFYGNSISTTDTSVIDTLADIDSITVFDDPNVDANQGVPVEIWGPDAEALAENDGSLNAYQIQSVVISGTSSNIDAAQAVSLSVEDGAGMEITANSTLNADGSYSFAALDLSGLQDGELTVTVASIDIPGNPTESSFTFLKDTQAAVTINFDGDLPLSALESQAVSLSGSVNNIELGQKVQVIVSDGVNADVVYDAVTVQSGGVWQTAAMDLTGFDDGTLTASVKVADVAGNLAEAATDTVLDSSVVIDIDTSASAIDISALRAGDSVVIRGSTDAESGQKIQLSLTDALMAGQTFETVVIEGGGSPFINSWSVNVEVTDLAAFIPWTLQASVTDIAGNAAADSPASIINPSYVSVSEEALVDFPSGFSIDSDIRIGNYDSAVFSADQSQISEIKSGGTALTVTGEGTTVLTASAGANDVFTAEINPDGTITLTLLDVVDHGVFNNSIDSFLRISALQNDTDGTSETLQAQMPFSIKESLSFTAADNYEVIEAESASANLFDNDNTLEGPLNIIFVAVGAEIKRVSELTPAVFNTDKGDLTVYSDGRWTFDSRRNLDHDDPQSLDFVYGALDADQDFSRSQVTLTVIDGEPGIFPSDEVEVVEPDFSASNSPVRTFTITAGSDNLDPGSIAFADSQLEIMADLNYTSSGYAVTYDFLSINDLNVIEAMANGQVVFTITLTAVMETNGDLTATATIDQSLPLDNFTSDGLTFPLAGVATDIDGTISGATSVLIIDDGTDPQTSAVAGAMTEEMLGVDTKDITVTIGSDQVADIGFLEATEQPRLTSAGEVLRYEISNNDQTLKAYTFANGSGDPHFTIEIDAEPNATTNSTLSYTFTQYKAIDQLNAEGESVDDISPLFRYQVTDYDDDEVVADIAVTITDADRASGNDINMLLTEGPRKLQAETLLLPRTLTTDFSLTAGADQISRAEFDLVDGAAVLDSGSQQVTQNLKPLTWHQEAPDVWVARNELNESVIRLELPEPVSIDPMQTGTVPFKVSILQPIDQVDDADPLEDKTVLAVGVIFEDVDGTATPLQANITVVDGRDPIALAASALLVDEAQTLQGSVIDNGLAYAFEGSDQPVDVRIAIQGGVTITTDQNPVLPVTLASTADANGWWVASNGVEDVFRVRIGLDGVSEFELFKAINHDSVQGRNLFDILFDVQLQDADLDWSNTITWTVQIKDDVPLDSDITLQVTEGAYRPFQLLPGGLSGQDSEGADGAIIDRIFYDHDDSGATADQEFILNGSPVDVPLWENGEQYGTLRVWPNGSALLSVAETENRDFEDVIRYQVLDGDGDVEINSITIDVQDEFANIDIQPRVTLEDMPVELTLLADPGDLDNGEQIRFITFANAPLQEGILTLDGAPLPLNADGNPFLKLTGSADDTLIIVNAATGQVSTAGTLVFTPALNTSDPTDDVNFNVDVLVQNNDGIRQTLNEFTFTVIPVADAPIWSETSDFVYQMDEDGSPATLNLEAALYDTDGSEALTYRIESIESGLTLLRGQKHVEDGDILNANQLAALQYTVPANFAGKLLFVVVAIATETSTGETAESPQTVTIEVAPVADTPKLQTNSLFTLEDELIPLGDFVSGSLSDNDGSETLYFEFDLPDGWSVVDNSSNVYGLQSANFYRVSADDVDNGLAFLKSKEDISSASPGGGIFDIPVKAIAVESSAEGVASSTKETASDERIAQLQIQGIVDMPKILPDADGDWSFNSDTDVISGSVNEDQLIRLDFITGTEDDDDSEKIAFLIKNVPEQVQLVDSEGNLASLKVVGEENSSPVYSLSADELVNLYLKPLADYSGLLQIDLIQTNTEPDGDSGSFPMTIKLDVLPVVEPTSEINLFDVSRGGEDTAILLDIKPVYVDPEDPDARPRDFGDDDGSEQLTNVIIGQLAPGTLLLVDYQPVSGFADVNLANVAADFGYSFDELVTGGHLRIQPPEDDGRDFSMAVQFEITDDSGSHTDVQLRPGTLYVDNWGIVDDNAEDGYTRIETSDNSLISSDGSAIDLSGMATFIEEDIDGSEWLDYISLSLPAGQEDGWFITHPLGAINDGKGNWLIKANSLSSDNAVDISELLEGATIVSDHVTPPGGIDLEIKVRVIDQHPSETDLDYDADILIGVVNIVFEAPGDMGSADPIDELQVDSDRIDGKEHKDTDRDVGGTIPPIDISGHVDQNADGDANDVVSFRIDAEDLPQGGRFRGADVIAEYADDGTTVVAWVFSDASLPSLELVGQNEDFSGDMTIPVHKISTDPLGKTVVTEENLYFDIEPDVDDVEDDALTLDMIEDIPRRLDFDLNSLLNDRSTLVSEGLEEVTAITFTNLPAGASFWDPGGNIVEHPTGTFTLSSPNLLTSVFFIPPANKHGEMTVDMALTITDTTTGSTVVVNEDEQTKTSVLTFEVIADTDPALVVTSDVRGDEDTLIDLTGLLVIDIDADGSETLAMQFLGVPAGAVIYHDNGVSPEQVVNDGADSHGGFTWSFTKEQLPDLVLQPPRDFAGDIPLTLRSTSMELSTNEIVTNEQEFIVYVSPIADGAEFQSDAEDILVDEGQVIVIDINARQLESINPNETLLIAVKIPAATTDAQLLAGTSGIRNPATGESITFVADGLGNLSAALVSQAAEVESIEIFGDANVFGRMEVEIAIGSVDSAVVAGKPEVDSTAGGDLVSQAVQVDITPVADAPTVDVSAEHIFSAVNQVPLNINMTLVSPIAAGETSQLLITGVPEGVSVVGAVQSGNKWIAQSSAAPGLYLDNVTAGETYNLSVQGQTTLDGNTVSGGKQPLTVTMAADLSGIAQTLTAEDGQTNSLVGNTGADTLNAGTGADQFFGDAERDTVVYSDAKLSLEADRMSDFLVGNLGDHIDLAGIASVNGKATGVDLDTVINLDEVDGTTTMNIFDTDTTTLLQSIELTGISKDALNGGTGWATDADILAQMLTDTTLITS